MSFVGGRRAGQNLWKVWEASQNVNAMAQKLEDNWSSYSVKCPFAETSIAEK